MLTLSADPEAPGLSRTTSSSCADAKIGAFEHQFRVEFVQ